MQKFIFTILCSVLFATFCVAQETGKTSLGFEYTKHVSAGGRKLQSGDMALMHISLYKDSILLGSTYEQRRPVPMPIQDPNAVNEIQRPFVDAMLLMGEGDSLTVIWHIDTVKSLPPDLQDGKTLRYVMKMVEVQDSVAFMKKMEEENAKQEKLYAAVAEKMNILATDSLLFIARAKSVGDSTKAIGAALVAGTQVGMQTTESGIKYVILSKGIGAQNGADAIALTHYYGCTARGEYFDDSYSHGLPYPVEVGLGNVIPGWDELLSTVIPEGATIVALIPTKLAYGDRPQPGSPIQPGDDLVFYIEPIVYMK